MPEDFDTVVVAVDGAFSVYEYENRKLVKSYEVLAAPLDPLDSWNEMFPTSHGYVNQD